jgi:hypothetical protein
LVSYTITAPASPIPASPHSATLVRIPSGPFGATLSEFNFPKPTAAAKGKVLAESRERGTIARREWAWWKKFKLGWNREMKKIKDIFS